MSDPRVALQALGGPEIAVLAGVILGAASQGAVLVLDGLATSVAAVVAILLQPGVAAHLVGHRSREAAHGIVLQHLGLEPLLDLRIRAGEGADACLAARLLRSGLQLRQDTATTSSGLPAPDPGEPPRPRCWLTIRPARSPAAGLPGGARSSPGHCRGRLYGPAASGSAVLSTLGDRDGVARASGDDGHIGGGDDEKVAEDGAHRAGGAGRTSIGPAAPHHEGRRTGPKALLCRDRDLVV